MASCRMLLHVALAALEVEYPEAFLHLGSLELPCPFPHTLNGLVAAVYWLDQPLVDHHLRPHGPRCSAMARQCGG